MNRWKIESVEYINISYSAPYQTAENYLEDEYEESVGTIRKFLMKIRDFTSVIHRA